MRQNTKHKTIPAKTIERLLTYKSILSELLTQGQKYIRSYELAELTNNKQELVRRDIMAIQFLGNPAKGYETNSLLNMINQKLKLKTTINVGVIGVGRLGSAISSFFKVYESRFKIVALFDKNTNTIEDKSNLYNINELERIIDKLNITFVVLSVPPNSAQQIASKLNKTKVKGILNFTHVPLKVKKEIVVTRIDILREMEKLVYLSH